MINFIFQYLVAGKFFGLSIDGELESTCIQILTTAIDNNEPIYRFVFKLSIVYYFLFVLLIKFFSFNCISNDSIYLYLRSLPPISFLIRWARSFLLMTIGEH